MISGLLILFTLLSNSTSVTSSQVDETVFPRSLALAGYMTGYAALMALTGVLVVRLAKVWEDARTIYLIVILALLGMSVVFDQLCFQKLKLASLVLGAGFLFSIAIIELTLRASKLRLPFNFRLPCYLIFAAFFGTPLLLASRLSWIEFLGDLKVAVFPALVSLIFLTLIPAIRSGRSQCESNGSPWIWPYFPWSLFVVLFVAVIFRSNALAISYGPAVETGLFLNPLFFAPLMFVALILLMEIALVENQAGLRIGLLLVSPAVVCLGPLAHELPFQVSLVQAIEQSIGSATVIVGWGLVLLLLCFYRRGVGGARIAMSLTMMMLSAPTASSTWLQGYPSAVVLLAAFPFLMELSAAIVKRNSVVEWITTSLFFGILISCIAHRFDPESALLFGIVAGASSALAVGLFFETVLMKVVRSLVALTLGLAMLTLTWQAVFDQVNFVATTLLTVGMTLISVLYWRLTHRTGWQKLAIWNGALSMVAFVGMFKYEMSHINISDAAWPVIAGSFFFTVGVAITCVKAGAMEKIRSLFKYRSNRQWLAGF